MTSLGQNVVVVPVSSDFSPFFSGASGTPSVKLIRQTWPWRRTSTSTLRDSALTTEMPTPCSPPETAYPPPPNLPPAWSMVMTTSTVDFFSCWLMSTGMPRPLSTTRTAPSARIVTLMVSAWPASASSTELSTTS